ncbi:hypothetical protein BCF11_2367 [Collimonas sp. PA-H2]|nr:hypothetical protein BCF11_2367 [Collimonas sp. PA-H2]
MTALFSRKSYYCALCYCYTLSYNYSDYVSDHTAMSNSSFM